MLVYLRKAGLRQGTRAPEDSEFQDPSEKSHRKMLLRVPATALFILGAALGLVQGSARAADPCQARAYVFSRDARFVRIDLPELRIADVGNLWWLNINQVLKVLPDPEGRDLLIVTKTWKMLGIENPTRAEFDRPGLAALRPDQRGKLNGATVIPPLFGTDPVLDGRLFDLDGTRLLLTFYTGAEGDRFATGVYDRSYKLLRTIQNFPATERSCVSTSGHIWTTILAQPSRALQLDWDSGRTESRTLDQVGSSQSFSRTPVAFGDGCLNLIYEKRRRESADGVLHLYDVAADRLVSSFQTDRYADYTLLEGGKFILEDEKQFRPILDQGGQQLGLRQHKTGRLHLRDGTSGQTLYSLAVPENGRVATIGCQAKRVFYVSPGLLTLVDVEEGSVTGRVPIPFDEAFVLLAGPRP